MSRQLTREKGTGTAMVGILEKWNGGTREEGDGRCQATVIRNDGLLE